MNLSNKRDGHSSLRTTILLGAILLLVCAPYLLRPGVSFEGSDDRAQALVASRPSSVQPWFQPLWQPESPALKDMLFATQAAIGTALIVVFFVLKRRERGRRQS
jgi:cobalt/nickel transport protein